MDFRSYIILGFLSVSLIYGNDSTAVVPSSSASDTAYILVDGTPWNREFFPRERLLRQTSLDPALYAAYTYSANFLSGPRGSFAQQTYMAHLAYEFNPDLHLYADLGLWMPLYSSVKGPQGFTKEDARQGNVDFILPDIELEYKPSANTSVHLMIVNENDAMKAYGPWYDPIRPYSRWRNSTFYR